MPLRYLGNGPAATGGGGGWRMDPRLRFKCVGCNYLMSADPSVTDTCRCGRLHKDSDAGRLTSSFGDDAVEVYELTD